MTPPYETALIVGAGSGLSAALARAFVRDRGLRVALAARNPDKLAPLVDDLGAGTARAFACDAAKAQSVAALFDDVDAWLGAPPDVVVYNPSSRIRAPFVELEPQAVADVIAISAFGGFLVAQAAARRMLERGYGAIVFTGASASIKGYAQSASFAMGKFALRGLAQSIARELAPRGIHVIHLVIDGAIRTPQRAEPVEPADPHDSMLDPDAIARTCLHLLSQDRSAWTWEIELRPWVERF